MSKNQIADEAIHDFPNTTQPIYDATPPHVEGVNSFPVDPSYDTIILQLESIFATVLADLAQDRMLSLPIRSRPTRHSQNQASSNLSAAQDHLNSSALDEKVAIPRRSRYCFPGRNDKEASRFTIGLRILKLVHQGLVERVVTTKRNIFYNDPTLFGNQAVVDRFVDDLAFTLGVRRLDLGVVAAPRGLVAGSFKLERAQGGLLDVSLEKEGMLVPTICDGCKLDLSDISWVLVVEKEATFRTLVGSRFQEAMVQNGMIVTAKGYPDIQTRSFLKAVHETDRMVPQYVLVDWDPDGISIFQTYAYGSINLSHETHALSVPSMQWLGIRFDDLLCSEAHKLDYDASTFFQAYDQLQGSFEGLMTLTARDRGMAVAMLRRTVDSHQVPLVGDKWIRELQVMLVLGVKAEIQALDVEGRYLQNWLLKKLRP